MTAVPSAISSVVRIQSLFDEWRQLDSKRLNNGTELIAWMPDEESGTWMHVVFHGLSPEQVTELEEQLGCPLPNDLRALYRWCNGMALFTGAFRIYGRRRPGVREYEDALQPDDMALFNHELDVLGWKPAGAVAFAQNGWDLSVHVCGMGATPREVVRCDRASGRILERHANVFECVAQRITRMDDLIV